MKTAEEIKLNLSEKIWLFKDGTISHSECLSAILQAIQSPAPVMSAGQVEELTCKAYSGYCGDEIDSVRQLTQCTLTGEELAEIIGLALKFAAPTVKDDGFNINKQSAIIGMAQELFSQSSVKPDVWVSVEEKQRLEQIIELKEKERQEWANMCITKQKRIEELENKLRLTDFHNGF